MKWIGALLLCTFCAVAVSADVVHIVDEKGKTMELKSESVSAPWDRVDFSYSTKGKPVYYLSFTKADFSGKEAALVVDGAPADLLKLAAAKRGQTDSGQSASQSWFALTGRQVSSIRDAKSVEVRVYFLDQPAVKWQVPIEILDEWKRVIDSAGRPPH